MNFVKKNSNIGIFARYVAPSMLGMLAVSMNTVADAVICGNGIGGNGIAGVNLGTPIISLSYATGMLFGSGAGTIFSIYKGYQNAESGEKPKVVFSEAVIYGLITGILLMTVIFLFRNELPWVLGATETTYSYAYRYLMGSVFFVPAFILDLVMNMFTRNDGAPRDSMIATIICVIFNIIVDYIFVFYVGLGTFGAAAATGMASCVSILAQCVFALRRKNSLMRFKRISFYGNHLLRIVKNGAGAFSMELSVGIIAICFNNVIGQKIGDIGLSVYGILTTLNVFFYSLHSGVAQGMQPLISLNFGEKKYVEVREYLKYALITAVLTGAVYFMVGNFGGGMLASLMVKEPETVEMATKVIRYFFVIYVFMGLNIVAGTYYQAIESGMKSLLIMFGRGMVFPLLALMILKEVGTVGIWIAQPVGEGVVTILAVALLMRDMRCFASSGRNGMFSAKQCSGMER